MKVGEDELVFCVQRTPLLCSLWAPAIFTLPFPGSRLWKGDLNVFSWFTHTLNVPPCGRAIGLPAPWRLILPDMLSLFFGENLGILFEERVKVGCRMCSTAWTREKSHLFTSSFEPALQLRQLLSWLKIRSDNGFERSFIHQRGLR